MSLKPFAAGFELSWVAAGLMIAMLAVMWAERPGTDCVRPLEPKTALVLSRPVDREHLATDLASVDRIAERYSRTGHDRDQQRVRFADCEATLVQQIAAAHSLQRGQVREIATAGQE
jgi:hypothetical protein